MKIFVKDGMNHLVYADGMEFWMDANGQNIWSIWPDSLTLGDAATYLLGPVLGILLRRRGTECLHASAVALQGKAILFAGDAGAGKSTTAAAMARRGHPVLSDDIVAVTERDRAFWAASAYPYLSLWQESVEMLYGSETKLPAFSPSYAKKQLALGIDSYVFQEFALPLGCIFVFAERCSSPQAPAIEELTLQESLMALIANSYATKTLDKEMRAKEFGFFGRMISTVRFRRLRPHKDPRFIERMCEAIENFCIGG